MENKKSYLVSYRTAKQISPEWDYEMRTISKIFSSTDKLEDVENWLKESASKHTFNDICVEISIPKGLNENEVTE